MSLVGERPSSPKLGRGCISRQVENPALPGNAPPVIFFLFTMYGPVTGGLGYIPTHADYLQRKVIALPTFISIIIIIPVQPRILKCSQVVWVGKKSEGWLGV